MIGPRERRLSVRPRPAILRLFFFAIGESV
jgi:hypothetical protein